MKKFFTLLVLAACCAAMTWGCSDDKYDDTEIRQEIENLKQEIASMKEQVNSLKTIIDALNENKFITNYTEAADGSRPARGHRGRGARAHPRLTHQIHRRHRLHRRRNPGDHPSLAVREQVNQPPKKRSTQLR